VDRAEEHFYRHAFLHADRLSYAHPDLDAHAQQHAAAHLHGFTDADSASHGIFDTYTYLTAHVDGFSYAHAASHAHLHIHTHGEPEPIPIGAVAIPRML
jgi:hypothetical protein